VADAIIAIASAIRAIASAFGARQASQSAVAVGD
jgi:hypothetical protein